MGGVEIQIHSSFMSAIGEWSASSPGCFTPIPIAYEAG